MKPGFFLFLKNKFKLCAPKKKQKIIIEPQEDSKANHPRYADDDEDDRLHRKNGFDLLFLRRSLLLHRLFFPSWRADTAFLAVILLLLGAGEQVIGYYVGLITSDYYLVR